MQIAIVANQVLMISMNEHNGHQNFVQTHQSRDKTCYNLTLIQHVLRVGKAQLMPLHRR